MEVVTESGVVSGVSTKGIVTYLGIPYGASTAGRNRFAAPQPASSWVGVRPCDDPGSEFPQDQPLGTTSEDSLRLHLWVPPGAHQAPVVFWVHGGGFRGGSASRPRFTPHKLAADLGAIVVSATYRLGALGWLAIDGDPVAGNAGLLDTLAALDWVKRNISAFGGDPDRVVAVGSSSGAMILIAARPHLEDRVVGLLALSGAGQGCRSLDDSTIVAEDLCAEVGARSLEELRACSVTQVLEAQARMNRARMRGNIRRADGRIYDFGPAVDGHIVPHDPLDASRSLNGSPFPVVLSTTAFERQLQVFPEADVLDEVRVRRRIEHVLGDRDITRRMYAMYEELAVEPWEIFEAFETDRLFRQPAQRLLDSAEGQTNLYSLLFCQTRAENLRMAAHGFDTNTILAPPAGEHGRLTVRYRELLRSMWEKRPLSIGEDELLPPYWPDRSTALMRADAEVVSDPDSSRRRLWTDCVGDIESG